MTVSNFFALSSALVASAATGFWGYCLFDLARTGEWKSARSLSLCGCCSWSSPTSLARSRGSP
jgi:hypothetical protein